MRGSPALHFGDSILVAGAILDHWLHFGWPRMLQVAIKGHLSLELGLYSLPVSMSHGFSLYDALGTSNSLCSDVTLFDSWSYF